jgi:NAD(P)-dependent dehydrogenase (short-subunit alcohol dehydrogenase family)
MTDVDEVAQRGGVRGAAPVLSVLPAGERQLVPHRLRGRVAIVTGAGRGIGAAVARRLAGEGAAVVVGDLDGESAARVAGDVRDHGGTACELRMDVTSAGDRATAVAAARDLGGLHLLVNAAGIIVPQLPHDVDLDSWRRVFAVNVEGLYFCCQAVLPTMQEQRYGRIVNFSSTGAKVGTAALISYNASKSAVLAITRGLAARYGPDGITVNSVLPGIVDTPMWETIDAHVGPMIGLAPGTMMQDRVGRIPLGRPGVPDDVASVVAFFVSDDAGYVTGQELNVCGGLLMT